MSLAWPSDFHRHFVIINVSGFRYVLKKRQILKHPKTRLAQIIADEKTLGRELYCDRNPYIFPFISDFYRHGIVHLPNNTYCWTIVREELLFWGITLHAMPDCCTIPISDELRQLDRRRKLRKVFGDDNYAGLSVDLRAMDRASGFQRGYVFFYQSFKSVPAQFYNFCYTLLTLLFAFNFVFECVFWLRNSSGVDEKILECWGNDTLDSANDTLSRAREDRDWVTLYQLTRPDKMFFYLNGFCLIIFAFDFILRLVFYPSFIWFFLLPLHIIDLISLLANCTAFYFTWIHYAPFWCYRSNVSLYFALELFRIFRIARLFCLAHKYSWMNVLYLTFRGTLVELSLLIAFLSIGVSIFGLGVYIPEIDSDSAIMEPFQGLWYAIVTITTLGYGDFIPSTAAGYAVGAVCCTSGVIFVSLQMPLIASIFNDLYDYANDQKLQIKENERAAAMKKKLDKAAAENETSRTRKTRVGFTARSKSGKSGKSSRSVISVTTASSRH